MSKPKMLTERRSGEDRQLAHFPTTILSDGRFSLRPLPAPPLHVPDDYVRIWLVASPWWDLTPSVDGSKLPVVLYGGKWFPPAEAFVKLCQSKKNTPVDSYELRQE